MKKKVLLFGIVLGVLVASAFAVNAVLSEIEIVRPDKKAVLHEYLTMIEHMENSAETMGNHTENTEVKNNEEKPKTTVYPDNYGGAYYGEDGYLHINITNEASEYDYDVDESMVVFHEVQYSLTYLHDLHMLLKEHMTELKITSIGTDQERNIVPITTASEENIPLILSFLEENGYPADCYEITVEETPLIVASYDATVSENASVMRSNLYFRPGEYIYKWDSGMPVEWATVLCNVRRTVGNTSMDGFLTAGHVWWNCGNIGNATGIINNAAYAINDYNIDASFVPFLNADYVLTGKIPENMYGTTNYIGRYITSVSAALQNYDCIAFGKTTGKTTGVEILDTEYTYQITNTVNGTTYSITGMKTGYYAEPGDSGGPLVYENDYGNYTLVAMTSATSTGNYTAVVPITSIIDSLNVTICGGNY